MKMESNLHEKIIVRHGDETCARKLRKMSGNVT